MKKLIFLFLVVFVLSGCKTMLGGFYESREATPQDIVVANASNEEYEDKIAADRAKKDMELAEESEKIGVGLIKVVDDGGGGWVKQITFSAGTVSVSGSDATVTISGVNPGDGSMTTVYEEGSPGGSSDADIVVLDFEEAFAITEAPDQTAHVFLDVTPDTNYPTLVVEEDAVQVLYDTTDFGEAVTVGLVLGASPTIATSLAIGTDPADAGALRLPNAGYVYSEADATGTDISVIGVDSFEVVQIGASGSSGVTITPATTISGDLSLGAAAASTGAATGDLLMSNATGIYFEADAAGTDVAAIVVGSDEKVVIAGSGSAGVTITPATTITGALTLSSTFTDGVFSGDGTGGITGLTNLNSVIATELAELETLGTTSIEAADWTAVAAMSGVNTGDNTVATAAASQAITDNALVTVDDASGAVDNEYARFTANGLESRTPTEMVAEFDDIAWTFGAVAVNLASATVTLPTGQTLTTPVIGAATGTSLDVTGTIQGTQLISDIAEGTAPLVVTSTIVVTNLNADELDGQSSAYYAPAASPTFTGIVTIPNAAAPTTDAVGEISVDLAAWTTDAIEYFDGTQSTYLIGAIASDAPADGEVPQWNTGGTITWEAAGAGDIIGVGDCVEGTCYDGADTNSGNYIRLWDGDSHYLQFDVTDLAANATITFGDETNNLYINNGTAILDIAAAATLNIDKGLTVGTNAGTLNFSGASKTLTILDDATLDQDLQIADTPAFAGLGLANAAVITFTDGTATTITHVDETGLLINLELEVDGTFDADGQLELGDGGDTAAINTSDWGITATGVTTGIATLNFDDSAAPTTDTNNELAVDNNAWTRGAVQFFDGTANTYLIGALVADAPANGEVATWNTGGTVTWESAGAGDVLADASVPFTGDVAINSATPALILTDTDSAAGTANIYFQATDANDMTVTFTADESGSPVTYMSFVTADDEVLFGQAVDMDTYGLDLSGNTTTLGAIAGTITGTISDGTASWTAATQALAGFSTIAMTGALSGATTIAQSHTAPTLTLTDSDSAAGTASVYFEATGANDMTVTFVADEGGNPITYFTLDTANDEVLFGQAVDMDTWALDLSGNTTTLSTIAGTLSDGTASWNTSTQALAGFSTVNTTGDITTVEDLVIGDAKYIGSTTDKTAIQIEADGDIVITDDIAMAGNLSIGANPADTGTGILMSNNSVIEFESDPAGASEVTALQVDAQELITIGDANASGVLITPATAVTGLLTANGGVSSTTITASAGFALGDTDYVGVTSNERFTFATAGTIAAIGANFEIGATSADETEPYLSIIVDADSDDAGDTDDAFKISITSDGTPTAALWDFTSTQSAGYTFDKEVTFKNNAAAATFGAVAVNADVVLAFDAVTAQGSITYMEDEDRFDFDNDVVLLSDSAVLKFGADAETTLTHTNDVGLTLNNKLTAADVTVTGTATVASLAMSGVAAPQFTFNDSSADGTDAADEESAKIMSNMTTTTEDAEVSDLWFTNMQAGATTTVMLFDGSANSIEAEMILNAEAGITSSAGAASGFINLYEASGGGTNYTGIKANADVTTSYTLVLPAATGAENNILKTDGIGNLSWTSSGSGTAWDDLVAPDNDETLAMNGWTTQWTWTETAADMFSIFATGAFGDVSVMLLDQNTGAASNGTMLEIVTEDADVDHLVLAVDATPGGAAEDYAIIKVVDAGTLSIDVTSDGTAAVDIVDGLTAGSLTSDAGLTIANGGTITFTDGASDTIDHTNDTGIAMVSGSGTVTIESVVFTTGAITGVTAITTDAAEINGSITLANDETISNATNGTITLTKNDSGTVILTAADDDANADLTVVAGGTGNLVLGDTSNATISLISDGVNISEAELIILDGVTSTTTQINYLDAADGETGSGSVVFDDTPTLITPEIGAATGTSLDVTGDVAGATVTIDNGGTITFTDGASDTIAHTNDTGIAMVSGSGTVTIESVVFTAGAMTAVTSIETPAIDASGAVGIDIGSIDVTDVTILTDGGADSLTIGGGTALDFGITFDASANDTTITFDEDKNAVEFASPIHAPIKSSAHDGAYTIGTDNAEEAYGMLFLNSAAGVITFTLPTAVAGMNLCIMQEYGDTGAITVQPAANDYIVYQGARSDSAADYWVSGGAAGDKICLVAHDATDWYATGAYGTWTEE